MASITELYTSMQTAVAALSKFTQGFPRIGGVVTASTGLSSTGFVPIIGPDPNRSNITFHNPGTNIAVVAPQTLGSSGGIFTPSLANLAGCFVIPPSSAGLFPGPWVSLSGTVQMGFQAAVLAGSSQPLTIMSQ